jgi:hypothetical protein
MSTSINNLNLNLNRSNSISAFPNRVGGGGINSRLSTNFNMHTTQVMHKKRDNRSKRKTGKDKLIDKFFEGVKGRIDGVINKEKESNKILIFFKFFSIFFNFLNF